MGDTEAAVIHGAHGLNGEGVIGSKDSGGWMLHREQVSHARIAVVEVIIADKLRLDGEAVRVERGGVAREAFAEAGATE